MKWFKKKTREDYRRERSELYRERERLRQKSKAEAQHNARVAFRKHQTAHLKREISELKYGKYRKAARLVGRDISAIARPIGRGLSAVGRKIATPTQADIKRQRRGQSVFDESDILGGTTFDYGRQKTPLAKPKKRKSLLAGIPD